MITCEYLKEILEYNSDTGLWKWKVRTSIRIMIGKKAGNINKRHGYLTIGIKGKPYYAHRLAWLYMTGKWPAVEIDHINIIKTDNRWCNLREASGSQNNANRLVKKGKLKGAFKCNGRWQALITKNYVSHYLGTFGSEQEAHDAYCKAAEKFHGEFSRTE